MPAAAVIRVVQALSGIIGRKGSVGGMISLPLNLQAQLEVCGGNGQARICQGCAELIV